MMCKFSHCRELVAYDGAKFCQEHYFQAMALNNEIPRLTNLRDALITARQCETRFGDKPGYNIEINKLSDQIRMYGYALRIFNE
jgi:hypothetical protein